MAQWKERGNTGTGADTVRARWIDMSCDRKQEGKYGLTDIQVQQRAVDFSTKSEQSERGREYGGLKGGDWSSYWYYGEWMWSIAKA